MDQGTDPSQHEDSNFNLYETYDTDMGDDAAMAGHDFPLGGGDIGVGWDHHHPEQQSGGYTHVEPQHDSHHYDPSATTTTTAMDDFGSTQYTHDFNQGQPFDQEGHGFQDFLAQDDQHEGNGPYHMNSMDLYHAPSIYPNLGPHETGGYDAQSSNIPLPVTESLPNNLVQPTIPPTIAPATATAATKGPTRQNFKFTAEQKQLLTDKFNAGLHYPTNAEKDALAQMFGVPSDSVSRWFERMRKEKGVQKTRKPVDSKLPDLPQYIPIQPLQPRPEQQPTPPSILPNYGQFPSTYPYNTLDPQFFEQANLQSTVNPATLHPSVGMYAPIPFVGQPLQSGMQNAMDYRSKGPQLTTSDPSRQQLSVEITSRPIPREDLYIDDTRTNKRPKISAISPTATGPKEIAPKPLAPQVPKKPMTFEQEVDSILRPSEWRDDPEQAAEDLYDLMGDAEDNLSQKLYLLRSLRKSATEVALRTITSEDNRRILAKLRNWFTAAIKVNDKNVLSVILEVITKMNIDGRTMAGIKLGKPLILLMKKDEPTLKAQLASLQKTAYEAYALEKDPIAKPYSDTRARLISRTKVESPAATSIAPTTTPAASTTSANSTSTAAKPPIRPVASSEKANPAPVNKIKIAPNKASGSSFFQKVAQTPTIPKTPVLSKPIPLKKSTTAPSQSMGMTAGGAVKPPATGKSVPPKPITPVPPKPAASTSKFSVLEYINRGDSSDNQAKAESPDASKVSSTKKRKRVSWATEDDLEHVKLIENITIKYADDLFWHPPAGFGNARDLDITEGRAFGKDTLEYDVEEEIEWYEPKPFEFSELWDGADDRGVKRAGHKVAEAHEAEKQKVREKGVLMVMYLNEGDIPESPSEPFLEELVSSQQTIPPKVIPLPQELRAPVNVPPPAVAPMMANSDVTAILSSLLTGSAPTTFQAPAAPAPNPDLASILHSLGQQPAARPPVVQPIDINALLSQLQPQTQPQSQPVPQQQRWTSPPPTTIPRREERHREPERDRGNKKRDRDPGTRIRASRSDDVRESVRNSSADQNMYRALCQFYVYLTPPKLEADAGIEDGNMSGR